MTEAIHTPLLSVKDLRVHFPVRGRGLFWSYRPLKAVDGVSFDLASGETLGIVGESGCGKSTLGRAVLQLIPPTAGSVRWQGAEIAGHAMNRMRHLRKEMQIIFQDPLASLDPRMTIGDIIAEPLRAFYPRLSRLKLREQVVMGMERVGLLPGMINRYPHEFSGGQCQRIGIARARILNPRMIVCDEPISALDVSIQAQILNLLVALQKEDKSSLLFISHDLSVVRHVSHRIMVLYLGKVMEIADRDSLYDSPLHPYTQALISAVPIPDPDKERAKTRLILSGDLPSPLSPPSGCVFRGRCPRASALCAEKVPESTQVSPSHTVFCHHPGKVTLG